VKFHKEEIPTQRLESSEREYALVNRNSVDEIGRILEMRPFVIITPARIYMDVLRPNPGRSCVVRPNMELNDRKFSHKELMCARRYLAQEGWAEYANGLWKPDPELSAFMDGSLE
jgi:hypothetical protein